jgi:membrane protease YdiL (CAAX protease family)
VSVTWNSAYAALVIVSAFVIYFVGTLLLFAVDAHIEGIHHIGFWVGPVSYLFLTLGVFSMTYFVLIQGRRASWFDVGFRLKSWSRVGSAVIGGVIAYFLGTVVIAFLLSFTSFHLKGNAKELLPSHQSHLTISQYIVLLILVSIFAPITEETLFRGVLYQAIRRDLGGDRLFAIVAAAVISGTIFGAIHLIGGAGQLSALPILAYLGIVLAGAFEYSDSLAGSALVHAFINGLAVTALLK